LTEGRKADPSTCHPAGPYEDKGRLPMRKFITAGMAIAMLAIPAVASADVERYQEQTASFKTTTPSGAGGVWTTKFDVTVNPCDDDSFVGTGVTTGMDYDGPKSIDEVVTGKFNSDNTVTFSSHRPQPLYTADWAVTNAPMNGSESISTVTWHGMNWTVVETVFPKTNVKTSKYKNHGEFVKQSDSKNDAAHSCIGMPVNSSK
jgi:hypothetical protein